ncbi:21799_t:CDS:2, partial [Racocetra persica]
TICLDPRKFGFGYETPPMGWNPYNAYELNFTEEIVRTHADIISSQGYLDVGYRYVNIDDGWEKNVSRGEDGKLVPKSYYKHIFVKQ